MDSKFRTSFIPKQEVALSSGRGESNFRFSLFSIIAIIIFTIAVILAIGVFIYQKTLVNNINAMNAELVAARASFEPSFVTELVTLDRRIESAKTLINKHNVVSPIFSILEAETVQGVRFKSLNYSTDSKGQPTLELNGEAVSFYAIALQSDTFNAESRIKNPVFSALNLDDKGVAKFNFKGGLDSSAFLYKNVINGGTGTTTDTGADSGSDVNITSVPPTSQNTSGSD